MGDANIFLSETDRSRRQKKVSKNVDLEGIT